MGGEFISSRERQRAASAMKRCGINTTYERPSAREIISYCKYARNLAKHVVYVAANYALYGPRLVTIRQFRAINERKAISR